MEVYGLRMSMKFRFDEQWRRYFGGVPESIYLKGKWFGGEEHGGRM